MQWWWCHLSMVISISRDRGWPSTIWTPHANSVIRNFLHFCIQEVSTWKTPWKECNWAWVSQKTADLWTLPFLKLWWGQLIMVPVIGGGRKFSLGELSINVAREVHVKIFQPHPLNQSSKFMHGHEGWIALWSEEKVQERMANVYTDGLFSLF